MDLQTVGSTFAHIIKFEAVSPHALRVLPMPPLPKSDLSRVLPTDTSGLSRHDRIHEQSRQLPHASLGGSLIWGVAPKCVALLHVDERGVA